MLVSNIVWSNIAFCELVIDLMQLDKLLSKARGDNNFSIDKIATFILEGNLYVVLGYSTVSQ